MTSRMADAPPRHRRGAHRPAGGASAVVLPSLLAVAAVVALIAALVVWRGEDDPVRTEGAPAPAPAPAATGAATPTGEPSPTQAPTSPSPTGAGADPGALREEVEVVVLNGSGIDGLAGRTAEQLEEEGWSVTRTGNFRGRLEETTVYVPFDDAEAAAELLADDLGGVRVRPRFGNLNSELLTVVVAEELG